MSLLVNLKCEAKVECISKVWTFLQWGLSSVKKHGRHKNSWSYPWLGFDHRIARRSCRMFSRGFPFSLHRPIVVRLTWYDSFLCALGQVTCCRAFTSLIFFFGSSSRVIRFCQFTTVQTCHYSKPTYCWKWFLPSKYSKLGLMARKRHFGTWN